MATYERRIDALGGTYAGPGTYADGHSDALTAACEIAQEADDVITELVECIDDLLSGGYPLAQWAGYAEKLTAGIKHRRDA